MFAAATAAVIAVTCGEDSEGKGAGGAGSRLHGLLHANERRLFANDVICLFVPPSHTLCLYLLLFPLFSSLSSFLSSSLLSICLSASALTMPAPPREGVAVVGVRLMLLLNCALCARVFVCVCVC